MKENIAIILNHCMMIKRKDLIVYALMLIGDIAIACLSDKDVVRYLGIMVSILTCISYFITTKEIDTLKEKSENAVYWGADAGEGPDVNEDLFKK